MPDEVTSQAYELWVMKNPLRSWRAQNDVSIMEAAARTGVSMNTIRAWETGASEPSETNMDALQSVMANRRIRGLWLAWRGEQPSEAVA